MELTKSEGKDSIRLLTGGVGNEGGTCQRIHDAWVTLSEGEAFEGKARVELRRGKESDQKKGNGGNQVRA